MLRKIKGHKTEYLRAQVFKIMKPKKVTTVYPKKKGEAQMKRVEVEDPP